jgi:hypothetical protein
MAVTIARNTFSNAALTFGSLRAMSLGSATIGHEFSTSSKMLLRQVGANDLRTGLGRRKVDVDAFPSALPIRIGEEASQCFRLEITLAFEVSVECAPGQSRLPHDGIY